MRIKRLLVLAFIAILLIGVSAYSGWYEDKNFTVSTITTDAGDTAQVIKFNEISAKDSQAYLCSLSFGYVANTVVVTWETGVQVMRFTPLIAGEGEDHVCSVLCPGATKYEIAWTAGADDTTIAIVCDSITALINGLADLTDSVTAVDSVTYVKVSANFSEENLGGAFSLSTSNTDTLDTSTVVLATVASVIDSLYAYLVADDTANYYASYTDEDTVLVVTSNFKGLAYTLTHVDTAMDSAVVTANKTSLTSTYDTVKISNLIFPTWDAVSGHVQVILTQEAADSLYGAGEADTARIWLYSKWCNTYTPLDSLDSAAIPCTATFSCVNMFDTIIDPELYLKVFIYDTITYPNSYNVDYDMNVKLLLRE